MSQNKIDKSVLPVRYVAFHGVQNINIFTADAFYVYCKHEAKGERKTLKNGNLFEVVPDYEVSEGDKHEKVMILYAGDTTPSIAGGECQLKCVGSDGVMKKYQMDYSLPNFGLLKSPVATLTSPKFWEDSFWRHLHTAITYNVVGLPKYLEIKIYSPDQYRLEINFPQMRSFKGGVKFNKPKTIEKSTHYEKKFLFKYIKMGDYDEKKEEITKRWHPSGRDITTRKTSASKRSYRTKIPIGEESSKIEKNKEIFRFIKNGKLIKFDAFEMLGGILNLGAMLHDIIQSIRDNIPKIGWYYDWNYQSMQGNFVVEFGWEEYTDHRAFLGVSAGINITIFEVNAEIGIGVDIKAVKIQIFASIEGSVGVSINAKRISPDNDLEINVPIDAQIEGDIGFRAAIIYIFEIEGKVTSSIKLKDAQFRIGIGRGVSIEGSLIWTGLKVSLKASGKVKSRNGKVTQLGEKNSKTITLIEAKELGKLSWPSDKQYVPARISRERIKEILNEELTKDTSIRVRGLLHGINKDWNIDEIAAEIENQIDMRQDIKRDEKTINLLACRIRSELEDLGKRQTSISSERFTKFTRAGELNTILNEYIDPLKEVADIFQ